jgi:ligand-binding sensor domain-containing protein
MVNPGLGSEAGTIYLYDPVTHRTLYKHSSPRTFQWTTSPSGDVWITGTNGLRLLRKNDLEQGIFREQQIPEEFSSVKNRISYYIRFDKIGRLWMSIPNEGILLVQPGKPTIEYTEVSGLASSRISFVFQDKEENNWFIPEGRGVQS